jgi:BlaI family transcriptional regulator, penicillinase repressor
MTNVIDKMTGVLDVAAARLTKFEIQIMETLWRRGEASIREMQEAFAAKKRPGYTTIQKMVYRLEAKKVVRRVRKVGNFHMFVATVSRESVQRKLVDELLAVFGGEARPVVAHLIGAGRLTLEDVEYAEKTLKQIKEGGKPR